MIILSLLPVINDEGAAVAAAEEVVRILLPITFVLFVED